MAIIRGEGNLLKQDVDALVNTVNTQGVMGKGLALQFKKAWPEMFKAYASAARRGEIVPGRMHVWESGAMAGPRFIINFPTKRHWRQPSTLADIQAGLADLVRVVGELDIKSIAVPPLGCGNGGLNWEQVRPLIESAFGDIAGDTQIVLFGPDGAPPAADQAVREPAPALTPARAALLTLMARFEEASLEPPSLIAVQKLAYFLQLRGQPLRLGFSKGTYGPYADDLRKTLRAMEGHFIDGFGDGSARVLDAPPITPRESAVNAAGDVLAEDPTVNARVDQVLRDIEGFESQYGLELLGSVHWVMTHNPAAMASAEVAHDLVRQWSQRKARLFTRDHVGAAWDALRERDLVG